MPTGSGVVLWEEPKIVTDFSKLKVEDLLLIAQYPENALIFFVARFTKGDLLKMPHDAEATDLFFERFGAELLKVVWENAPSCYS